MKIFNNLPLEIRNVAGNNRKFKIAMKKFLHTHFTQMKSTLVNRDISTASQDFITVVCDLIFGLCALCSTLEL